MGAMDWIEDHIIDPAADILDFGAEEAAQAQADASLAALGQQGAEAQRAREFMQQQARYGENALRGAEVAAFSELDRAGYNAEQDLANARRNSLGALGLYGGMAADPLGQLANTQSINTFDALGQRSNRLGDLYAGGLGAGFETDPGYQFRQKQGEDAINRAAAARGGRMSGRTLKELAGFNQDLASQEFGNYANRQIGMAQGADAMDWNALANQAGRNDAAALAAQGQRAGGLGALGSLWQSQGQQATGIENQFGTNLANLTTGTANSLANLYTGTASQIANNAMGVAGQNNQLSQSMMGAYAAPTQYAGGAAAAQGQGQANLANMAASGLGTLWDAVF